MIRPVLALGGVLLLAACVMPQHHHHHHGWSMLEEEDEDAEELAASGNSDLDFLRAMAAHHREGMAMAGEARGRAENAAVRDLARRLENQARRDAERAEALERRLAP